jgi:hypothetical protein
MDIAPVSKANAARRSSLFFPSMFLSFHCSRVVPFVLFRSRYSWSANFSSRHLNAALRPFSAATAKNSFDSSDSESWVSANISAPYSMVEEKPRMS